MSAKDYIDLDYTQPWERVFLKTPPAFIPPPLGERWHTANGLILNIPDMDAAHARNALAMIVKHIRAGHVWGVERNGRITYTIPARYEPS